MLGDAEGKLVFAGRFWGAGILRSTVKAGRHVLRAEWMNSGGVVSGLTLCAVYPT